MSMDICRIFANTCKDEIRWKVKSQYSEEIFFADYFGRDWKLEMENIRAEQRESRDLLQDLQKQSTEERPFSRHSLSESRRRAKLEPQKFRNFREQSREVEL